MHIIIDNSLFNSFMIIFIIILSYYLHQHTERLQLKSLVSGECVSDDGVAQSSVALISD